MVTQLSRNAPEVCHTCIFKIKFPGFNLLFSVNSEIVKKNNTFY